MYDADLAVILDEDDEFAENGRGKYQYIEASCTINGVVTNFQRDELKDSRIEKWASKKPSSDQNDGQPLFHLKILSFEADDSDEESNSTLPCSKLAYDAIKTAWKMPDWTLRFLDNRGGQGLVLPYGALTKSKYIKRVGIATKNANSHQMFAIYDPSERLTTVLVRADPSRDFTIDELLNRVEKNKEASCFPILALLLLMEALATDINDFQGYHNDRIETIQRKQAFFAFDDADDEDKSNNEEEENEDQGEEEDLLDFTRELTKLFSLSRALQRSLEDFLRCMSLVQTMHEMFIEALDPSLQSQAGAAWHDLFDRLAYAEIQSRKNLDYSADNQQEITASIQTVYAFIGTNDSHLNYESAQASVEIAKDSRRVAILARQDSTDMRVIAGTTLLFLPATFVATLFSTDFFNFQPSKGLVSHWIWLYFAVSIALTVPVMVAWRLLSKARAQETAQILRVKDLNDDEQQNVLEMSNGFTSSMSSGNALQDIKNRLSKRKKTPTMEMEEK